MNRKNGRGRVRISSDEADHMKVRDVLRNKSFGDITYIQYGLWFPIGK